MAANADGEQQEPDQPWPSANAEPLRVHLLDSFRVSCGGRIIIDESWSRGKAKALIKLLALAAPSSLHREQVIEALWPQHSAVDTAGSLRQAIFQTRSALKGDSLERELVQASGHVLGLAPYVTIDQPAAAMRARCLHLMGPWPGYDPATGQGKLAASSRDNQRQSSEWGRWRYWTPRLSPHLHGRRVVDIYSPSE